VSDTEALVMAFSIAAVFMLIGYGLRGFVGRKPKRRGKRGGS
jgi:hypothetical protein